MPVRVNMNGKEKRQRNAGNQKGYKTTVRNFTRGFKSRLSMRRGIYERADRCRSLSHLSEKYFKTHGSVTVDVHGEIPSTM